MPVISLHVGQCGNQVGHETYDVLAREALASCEPSKRRISDFAAELLSTHFAVGGERERGTGKEIIPRARAIMIDAEPRVVQGNLVRAARSDVWNYRAGAHIAGESGSGNNWAHGFYVHGPRLAEDVTDELRREYEKCDCVTGVIIMHSLGGGTGSGLGTYITELVREMYPKAHLLNQLVWPFTSGDVIVQDYNTCLSLSHLLDASDALLVSQNSDVLEMCKRGLGLGRPGLHEINSAVARDLAACLMPASHRSSEPRGYAESGGSSSGARTPRQNSGRDDDSWTFDETETAVRSLTRSRPVADFIRTLCSHPWYKIVGCKSLPQVPHESMKFSTHKWRPVVSSLARMQGSGKYVEEFASESRTRRSVGSLLALRGCGSHAVDVSPLRDPRLYPPWLVKLMGAGMPMAGLSVTCSPHGSFGSPVAASLASNDGCICECLDRTLGKASEMLHEAAYVHHFTQRGMEADELSACLARLEQTLSDYRALDPALPQI